MIPNYLSAIWPAAAPALGNHLWQSTLCLALAGILTLMMRKNRAGARYALWLAASVKFLIPFSLLIAVGIHLGRPIAGARPTATGGVYWAMEEVSQPFTPRAASAQAADTSRRPAQNAGLRFRMIRGLPAVLVAVWFCGFLVVLAVWCARWRRISAAVREAVPSREGRELEALRRWEHLAGVGKRIEMRVSRTHLEPGIFGIVKPVLVWPEGISERLDDAQLEAILAHEVWHVRRRDNLAAALHMLVEALFWFHPLVWWLGAQLVEERERACDEDVLRLGHPPQAYAESILKTCEFCVGSPLACVSGVTGADLKERIIRIMTKRLTTQLSLGRKLLLAMIGLAAVAGPIVFGLLHAPQVRAQSTPTPEAPAPSFEVASIKPNKPDASGRMMVAIQFAPGRFTTTGATLKQLIALAYDVRDTQVSGGPGWTDSERYDIDAKEADADVARFEKLPPDQRRQQHQMLVQGLLADRFKLRLRHESKESMVYALVVAKNGPKLHEAKPGDTYPNGIKGPDGRPLGGPQMMRMDLGEVEGQGLAIEALARLLSRQLGREVVDKTGLKGSYDFTLKWNPEQDPSAMAMGPPGGPPAAGSAPPADSSEPSIFTAIQDQLGLKLESTKGPVEILIVDHVEQPSEN
ncbi:MAG: M56 and DUF3738 domain-containing protein [Terriglobia bacterium]|jgi:uncharacterized protein (TIGR03435 family)